MATRTRNSVLVVTFMAATVIPGAGGSAPADSAIPTPTVRIMTPEYEQLITSVLELYGDAGLMLTDIEIGVYDDQAACGQGRDGFHHLRDDHTSVVLVCAVHADPRVRDRSRRHVLLHELAHAWAEHQLSAATKDRFLSSRGLTVWTGPNAPWGQLGAEHAAEVIAWNIADHPYLPHVELSDRTCDGFATGYEILTDTPPPAGRLPICEQGPIRAVSERSAALSAGTEADK